MAIFYILSIYFEPLGNYCEMLYNCKWLEIVTPRRAEKYKNKFINDKGLAVGHINFIP